MPQSGPMNLSSPALADPTIEALRGIAALMVMGTHFTHLLTNSPGVWGFASTGVDLFFVLSGYVFAPYLFGKPLPLLPHLIRRFFRLYPLYVFALLLYVGLRWPAPDAWAHFGVHLAMAHTLQSLAIANFYNPAFWSLPPEVEYYLLLPVLALAVTKLRFLMLVGLAAFTHLLLVAAAQPDEGITWRSLATVHAPGLLIEFMLGSWAYILAQSAPQLHRSLIRLAAGIAAFILMAWMYWHFIVGFDGPVKSPPVWVAGNIGVGAAGAYALMVSALVCLVQHLPMMLQAPLVRVSLILGQLSYGVYLFHNAVAQWLARLLPDVSGLVAVLLGVGATLLVSLVAHHLIEKPLRDLGRRLGQTLRK